LVLFRLIAFTPKCFIPVIASWLSHLAVLFARKDAKTIKENIGRVYGLPAKSEFSRDFVRQVFRTQVLLLFETLRFVYRPSEVLITGIEEAQGVLSRASDDCGVVIIAAHHGAWELAGYAAAKSLPRGFYALAKPSRTRWFTAALNEIRERLGMKVLWTDSKSLLKDMMAVAQRKDHLAFVMDQRPGKRSGGLICRFLRVEGTHIVQGPAMMAAKKNMPVVGVHAMRIGPYEYKFFATEVLAKGHGLTDENQIAQLMADDLSRMIETYPEQWAWNYRRWK